MVSKQDETYSHRHLLIAFHVVFLVRFSEFLFWREGREKRGGNLMFSRLTVLEGLSFLSYIKNKFFINPKDPTPNGISKKP